MVDGRKLGLLVFQPAQQMRSTVRFLTDALPFDCSLTETTCLPSTREALAEIDVNLAILAWEPDSYGLARSIRAGGVNGVAPELRMMAMAASPTEAMVLASNEARMDDFLAMPISAACFSKRIRRVVGAEAKTDSGAAHISPISVRNPS